MVSNALAFDTHRFVKRMTAVGMPVQQAEALAESQVDLLNTNLATKNELAKIEATLKVEIAKTETALRAEIAKTNAEIAKTETALKADIAKIEATLKVEIAKTRAEIANTEAHLIKWMVGLTMGSAGVMVALFSFFLR